MKRFTVYPQVLKTDEDFLKVKLNFVRNQTIISKCQMCGLPFVRQIRHINDVESIVCTKCSNKWTMFKHYGVINVFQMEKVKQKSINTLKRKYGVINSSQRKEHWEKVSKTSLEKYGTERPTQSQKVKDKQAQTNVKKYGTISALQNKNVNKKTKETMFRKFGVEYSAQNKELRSKQRSKFKYNEIKFDSSWELAYYIWLKDNNIEFEYQPEPLTYLYEQKEHKYFPDFKINNELIEIKGKNWLKLLLEKGTKQEAKYKCMLEHNVKIITDCSKYLQYIKNKYGTNYLRKFKNNK